MATDTEPRYCYRHPDRETGLSCSECGRPICYECMTPAPVGLRCPEHSGKPQGVKKVTRAATRVATGNDSMGSGWPVTKVLIGINVAVFLAELAIGGNSTGGNNSIFYKGTLFAHGYLNGSPGVANGGWWRLITSGFLHYGIIHIGLNMLSLYWLGRVLEHVIGSWRYLMLYLAAGLGASAGALIASPDAFTAGASGAIFGILGALLVLEQRGVIHSGGQIVAILVLNLLYTFAFSGISLIPGTYGISVGGHIGGLITGILLMRLYLEFPRSIALCAACAAAVGAIAVVVAYAVI